MSRPIKFRGKRLDNGELVYGSLIRKYDKPHKVYIPFGYWIYVNENACHEVDPETVGQYIGINDKNDKEIYDRDILQDAEGIGEVEWVQEHCAYMVFTRNPSTYHRLESDGNLKHSEVIGNVWEHPHLLQEGEGTE